MKNIIKGILEQELYINENHTIAGIDNAVERLRMWFSGDVGIAALNMVQCKTQSGEPSSISSNPIENIEDKTLQANNIYGVNIEEKKTADNNNVVIDETICPDCKGQTFLIKPSEPEKNE
jgi:hypothetical protein